MEEKAPKLAHLKEFREILAHYSASDESKKLLKKTPLVILTGPTASGRNTIISELRETGNYYFIVSDTTRAPELRDGRMEQNGREYFFRTEEDVLVDLRSGRLMAAELIHNQQVSGMSIREIKKAADKQKIAITDLDILGVQHIIHTKPDTVAVVVLPPNFEEWQRRIMHRGFMSPVDLRRRMETALRIFKAALEHDYFKFVVNDTVDNAAIEINRLARFGSANPEYQASGRKLAELLYAETRVFLDSLQKDK